MSGGARLAPPDRWASKLSRTTATRQSSARRFSNYWDTSAASVAAPTTSAAEDDAVAQQSHMTKHGSRGPALAVTSYRRLDPAPMQAQ